MKKLFLTISAFLLFSNGIFASTLFEAYPWLADIVQPENCTTEKVEVYQSGIFAYLLVTDADGKATLYNNTGQFYCQSASNFDCVALYNLEGPIDSWDCAANTSSTCLVTIINTQCRQVEVYDENDNFLIQMDGVSPFGAGGPLAPAWEDPIPLGVDENRTYIFKENNLVLGRESVSCAIPKIEVVSNTYSGCTDILERFFVRNTGCRTITVHNTSSEVVGTYAPGASFYVSYGIIINIILAGTDTLAINFDDRDDLQVDSGGCEEEGMSTCSVTITNNQCRGIGVYDENDNLLTTMFPGPQPNGPLGQTAPVWEDSRPLRVEENRVYIFKENNLVLGRQTVTCSNTEINVVSNYFDGCTDAVGLLQLINTGCRTISVQNTQSEVLWNYEPGDTFYLSTGPFIYLLLSGGDTLAITTDNSTSGEIDSGGCGEESTCSITITNNQCRGIGVYDENDNFLASMVAGPHPFGPPNQASSIWEDPRPLGVDENRVYIFKENNFVLGRQTVSCDNSQISVVSNYFSGCTDALGIAELRNIGCRTIEVHNTRSEVVSSHAPGEEFFLIAGPAIDILIAGGDTLAVFANNYSDLDLDSGGCEGGGNQPTVAIPENFEEYYVIYTLCQGDTLSVPNPVRTIQCPAPPPGPGIIENFPFLRAPDWRSNTGDNFSVSFNAGTSELHLFPTETTIYEGSYPSFSCGSGPAGPQGFAFKYLVIVDDIPNCTSNGSPNFVIEACIGDIIELPSPNQVGQTTQYLCDGNIELAGGTVAELVSINGTVMKVRIKETGKFSINALGGTVQTSYNQGTIQNTCPVTSYQFEVKLKATCDENGASIALFDDYPWLADLVTPTTCTQESVELYQSGIFFYLLVKEANGREVLYNASGQFYCENSTNYDCVSAYNLGSPIDSWTCGETMPPVEECGTNTGTFFYRECDDGQLFYFIELADGTIYDPYFADGTAIEVIDGQTVKFDYIDADFASPCSIAEKAITLTCVETLDFPINNGDCRKNSGEIVVTQCDDGNDFFFIQSATDGLLYDAYFALGIDFLKYHGQKVNFDYVPANFNSPCSIADAAIIVTCIEERTANEEMPPLFRRFEWLLDLVDPFDCDEATLVTVYQQSIFNYLLVQKNGTRQLYFQDGTFYCQDSKNFDCVAAYSLESPIDSWSCSGTGLMALSERTNDIAFTNDLKLFPNPVISHLTVQLPKTIVESQQLSIFDTFGRMVLEKAVSPSTNAIEVDVTSFQNGLYYLVLFGNGKKVVQKFVKQDLK